MMQSETPISKHVPKRIAAIVYILRECNRETLPFVMPDGPHSGTHPSPPWQRVKLLHRRPYCLTAVNGSLTSPAVLCYFWARICAKFFSKKNSQFEGKWLQQSEIISIESVIFLFFSESFVVYNPLAAPFIPRFV